MNEQDLKILEAKGIAPAQVEAQLSRFKIGFPELEIKDSATVGCGIMRLSEEEQKAAAARWQKYLAEGGDAIRQEYGICHALQITARKQHITGALQHIIDVEIKGTLQMGLVKQIGGWPKSP